jgi:hypothetical protein
METQDTHLIRRDPADPKSAIGCIDLCYSPDDGGWYAHEYDFTRKDNATRTSSKIYPDRQALVKALDLGVHRWKKWD